MTIGDNLREPLNKSMASLRDLKRTYARRELKLMALVLNKIRNEAGVRFRSRPSGLTGDTPLIVASFRQADACLQRGVAIDESPVSQRRHRLVQRLPDNAIQPEQFKAQLLRRFALISRLIATI